MMLLRSRRTRSLVALMGIALAAAFLIHPSSSNAPAPDRAQAPVPEAATTTPTTDVAPVADAVEPAPVAAVPQAAAVEAAPAPARASGMIAYRDPETGVIGGMPAESELAIESASPALQRTPDAELTQTDLGRRGIMVTLDETFHEYSVARIDASGKLHIDCTTAPEAARLLQTPAPATVPAAEE